MLNQLSEMLPKPTGSTKTFMRPQRNKWRRISHILISACFLLLTWSCSYDHETDLAYSYPDEVGDIFRKNCATSGCHNPTSAEAAAGLNLETWEQLFKGSRGGSPVVPYSPEFSYLLYSINTDSTWGPRLQPTMPIGKPTLSAAHFAALEQWIADGARNTKGEERFPPQAQRRKWYVANQGCDQVAVLDAESRQVMRYIEVGMRSNHAEWPHAIVMSPDQSAWYVVFDKFSPHIEQYSTLTDERITSISLGHNGWNSMCISPNGKWGFVTGEQMREIAMLDLGARRLVGQFATTFQDIHAPTVHPAQPKLYVTQPSRSALYVMNYDQTGLLGSPVAIDLVQGMNPAQPGNLWPYKIVFSADGSRYYVACRHSNEVRVLNAANDSLLQVIQVGDYPVDMALSTATGQLFVACMEDTSMVTTANGIHGSVAVIDLSAGQVIRYIQTGSNPGGIDIDPNSQVAVVANRNVSGSATSQHHASRCSGVNGYLTLIDLNTLTLVQDYKPELLVDPAAVAIKR